MEETILVMLLEERARLAEEQAAIRERLDEVNRQIIDLLPVGETVATENGTARVATKKTFKGAIAEQMIARRVKSGDISVEERDMLYKQMLDAPKVKALFPGIYDSASVESDPFVTFRGA